MAATVTLIRDIGEDESPGYVGVRLILNGFKVSVPYGYAVTVPESGIMMVSDEPLRKARAEQAQIRCRQICLAADEARGRWIDALLSLSGEEGGEELVRLQVEQALYDSMDVTEQTRLGLDISGAASYMAGCRRR